MADSLRLEVQNRFGISVSSILPGKIQLEFRSYILLAFFLNECLTRSFFSFADLLGYIKTEIGGKSESYVNNVTAAQRELYSGIRTHEFKIFRQERLILTY